MKIVFIGSVEFSLHALKRQVELNAEVVGLCTLKNSKFNADHCDLSHFCAQSDIPSTYVDDINLIENLQWISNKSPDIIFCLGWKWFRHPSIKRVLAYETISEKDFGLIPSHGFRPNYFVNIEAQLDSKLAAMDIDNSELGDFPFPRSHKAIRALATIRGATSGFKAVAAFDLLRERL
jgi:hypothetical protein